jgi:hypothetical protein
MRINTASMLPEGFMDAQELRDDDLHEKKMARLARERSERERWQRIEAAAREACDLLAERTYGNPARSPGHNARIRLEGALNP